MPGHQNQCHGPRRFDGNQRCGSEIRSSSLHSIGPCRIRHLITALDFLQIIDVFRSLLMQQSDLFAMPWPGSRRAPGPERGNEVYHRGGFSQPGASITVRRDHVPCFPVISPHQQREWHYQAESRRRNAPDRGTFLHHRGSVVQRLSCDRASGFGIRFELCTSDQTGQRGQPIKLGMTSTSHGKMARIATTTRSEMIHGTAAR